MSTVNHLTTLIQDYEAQLLDHEAKIADYQALITERERIAKSVRDNIAALKVMLDEASEPEPQTTLSTPTNGEKYRQWISTGLVPEGCLVWRVVKNDQKILREHPDWTPTDNFSNTR